MPDRRPLVSITMRAVFAVLAVLATQPPALAEDVPAGIAQQLPRGYGVLASARLAAGQPGRSFHVVALDRQDEGEVRVATGEAPARPMLVFEQRGGRFLAAGSNDRVVMKADQGGQCDPFLDGGATIAVKGRYFTVENGVACGQHGTDYVTFRFDDRTGGFVFDNERSESWSMNRSDAPDAEALVRDGPPHVRRDRPGEITPLSDWRPAR